MKNFYEKHKKIIEPIISTLLIFIMVLMINYTLGQYSSIKQVSYNEFIEFVNNDSVEKIEIALTEKEFRFYLKTEVDGNHTTYKTANPKYDDFKKDMLEHGIQVEEKFGSGNVGSYMFSIISIGIMLGFFVSFKKQTSGEDGKFGKSNKSSLRFKDVAGLVEVKQDLETVVDFLKNPKKYENAGAKIPKGILLYGPPGTGKTMLAKAIAGEAGVEFISVVGSEFEERYVGVGASRIRNLFSEAKKKAPCIIFIDEIDAVGSKRKNGNSSSDRQCINQLLSEMDGFGTKDNIIVIAATNRPEDLDAALTRSGRFDSHFAVSLPTSVADRKAIIDIYKENKKFDESVDFDNLAKTTIGCSPSDIGTILNESAIIAAKQNDGVITKEIIDDAVYKQVMHGHKKKDFDRKEDELKIVAYHESAHAIVGLLLNQDVTKVTIVPSTNGAGGVTFFNQEKMGLYSKEELINRIKSLYAGRAGECIMNGESKITTGASNDITEATKIIKSMIDTYGMSSEYGMLNLQELPVDKGELIKVASSLSHMYYKDTMSLLLKNKDKLEKLATKLLEEETLTGDEIRTLMGL